MNEKDLFGEFEAEQKAIQFQELYYPADGDKLRRNEVFREAVRFAFAQGFKMAQAKAEKGTPV
jgi:hypothetical protein